MDAIPIDVLRRIFGFLDDPSHFAVAATCRTWRQMTRPVKSSQECLLQECAKRGYLNLVRWLIDTRAVKPPTPNQIRAWDLAKLAARNGHQEFLEYLLSALSVKQTTQTPTGAALLCSEVHDVSICSAAAEGGHLEVVKWLRARNIGWDVWTCVGAAAGGHLEVLQWAFAELTADQPHAAAVSQWAKPACHRAAAGGHLEILKWVASVMRTSADQPSADQDRPWGETTCATAAGGGHLEVVKWLRAEGCPWGASACANAAMYGRFEVLQWLHKNGCPWDANTTFSAAMSGRLDILEWVYASGCPWDSWVFRAAWMRSDRPEILAWVSNTLIAS